MLLKDPKIPFSMISHFFLAQQNLLLSKPAECSPKSHMLEADVCKPQDLDMDLVEHVGIKQQKVRDKEKKKSSSTTSDARTEGSSNGSLELEEDNYIPEVVKSY